MGTHSNLPLLPNLQTSPKLKYELPWCAVPQKIGLAAVDEQSQQWTDHCVSSSLLDHLSFAAFSWSSRGVAESSLESFFKSFLGGCCGLETCGEQPMLQHSAPPQQGHTTQNRVGWP